MLTVVTLLAAVLVIASSRSPHRVAGRAVQALPFVVLAVLSGCGSPAAPESSDAPAALVAGSASRLTFETPYKVKDLRTSSPLVSAGSAARPLVSVGSTVFFVNSDSSHGAELWKSDGTAAGTVLVKDIRPGFRDGLDFRSKMVAARGRVFFTADDGQRGFELWSSDGTAAGTVRLSDVNPGEGNGASLDEDLVAHGGNAYFIGRTTPTSQGNLWKSDGTPEGTRPLRSSGMGGTPSSLTPMGPTLYFRVGSILWKTDGTEAGTVRVKDMGQLFHLANVQGTLMFLNGTGVWKSDGTAAGTVLVKELTGYPSSTVRPAVAGGRLFFVANGNELWTSDGTPEGTVSPRSFSNGSGFFYGPIEQLTALGDVLFFTAASSTAHYRELWRSDGSVAGTARVSTVLLYEEGVLSLAPYNGFIYFPESGGGLWRSNGVDTTQVQNAGATGPRRPSNLLATRDALYFSAAGLDFNVQEALWKTDGTAGGTVLLGVAGGGRPKPASNPRELTELNGKLLFLADNDATGVELYSSDGTAAGTVLVKDVYPGSPSGVTGKLVRLGSYVYFSAKDSGSNYELWRSDGTPTGTQQVADLIPGTTGSSPNLITVVGNSLFFVATGPTNASAQLYRYPSASGGVELVTDQTGSGISFITELAGGEQLLYFSSGGSVWRSDGTAAGTFRVCTFYSNDLPSQLTPVGGDGVVFSANDGRNGYEPWHSDGTVAGTSMLELVPGSTGSSPGGFVRVGNGALFRASTLDSGVLDVEPFWTDGTLAGTRRINLNPRGNSNPFGFTRWNGRAVFHADDGLNGRRLWVSDGTELGTRPILDAPLNWNGFTTTLPYPGAITTTDQEPLMFAAADETCGAEPWVGSGTREGSHEVFDIRPGPASSDPRGFQRVGDLVFFSADDGQGQELWAVRLSAPESSDGGSGGPDAGSGGGTNPTVAITAPSSNALLAGQVSLAATAVGDPAVARVEFFVDGTLIGTAYDAPYALRWESTTVAEGAHALTAKVHDFGGRVGTSATVVVTVDNTGPVTYVDTPSSKSWRRGAFPFGAFASDTSGVARVEFYADATLLGTDTTAPHEVSWDSTGVTDGPHYLTVRAFDMADHANTSTEALVNIDNTAPSTPSLSAPVQDAWLRGTVQVNAPASDNLSLAKIEYYADQTLIGTSTIESYITDYKSCGACSVSWNTTGVTDGAHALTARVFDKAGNVSTSAAVGVNVDNYSPTVALSAPAQNALVGGTVTVSATASDTVGVARVEFYADGTLIGTDTTAPYSLGWSSTTVTGGAHVLTAKAYDGIGNASTSAQVSVTVDNSAPVAVLSAPAQDSRLRGTVQLSATASDTVGVARVEFYADGTLLGTDTTAPYGLSWNSAGVTDGAHALTVKAHDAAGGVGTSAAVSVTVDNTAPVTALGTPAQGSLLRGTVTVSATASDNLGVERVEFYAGTTLIGTATVAPYSVSWDSASGANGAITLTTRAYDAAGNVTVSAGRTVTVDNAAPTVAITSPANGATLSALSLSTTLQASASDNAGVTQVVFYDGATVMGTDTSAPYSQSWNLLSAAKGTHTLTAKAYDAAGNVTTSAIVSVRVN
ncbi:Ig-like domain-containing protein [Cystobacter fuscus]|uniref:Ig-like domain-containing protein n=1 Tax=Cystobacter fuscus TaxID=43 RepID=UPI0037C0261F